MRVDSYNLFADGEDVNIFFNFPVSVANIYMAQGLLVYSVTLLPEERRIYLRMKWEGENKLGNAERRRLVKSIINTAFKNLKLSVNFTFKKPEKPIWKLM